MGGLEVDVEAAELEVEEVEDKCEVLELAKTNFAPSWISSSG